MATVSKKIAEELVRNNGICPGDPQVYAVFKYENPHFDNKICYAIAYDENDFARYYQYNKEVLWSKDTCTTQE